MDSVCLMVSKLFLSEYVEVGFSSGRKHEKFAVRAHVLINTQNVVILHCCFAEDCYKMYQVLLCTCRAIVLLIKSFVLWRSRCRCCRGLLKLPNIKWPPVKSSWYLLGYWAKSESVFPMIFICNFSFMWNIVSIYVKYRFIQKNTWYL